MQKLFNKLKFLLPFMGAIFGAIGGQGIKYVRRVVLPIILSIFGCIILDSYYGVFLGTFTIWVSMGYGIPDATDRGSVLGRFWFNIFKNNKLFANIFTRGTIGIGMCLTGIIGPILAGNWNGYLYGCLFILVGQMVFSYRDFGVIHIKTKELLISDLLNYGLIFVGYMFMLI
jgi:hypothetical protein